MAVDGATTTGSDASDARDQVDLPTEATDDGGHDGSNDEVSSPSDADIDGVEASDGGDAPDRNDGPGDTNGDGTDGVAISCTTPRGSLCVLGGCSNDILVRRVCEGGTWRCPAGSIDPATCNGCIGNFPPGCTCSNGFLTCADGGADAPAVDR
ncbi:MAG: hypothetical protein ABJA82_09480 [Myxococcales bacterium]